MVIWATTLLTADPFPLTVWGTRTRSRYRPAAQSDPVGECNQTERGKHRTEHDGEPYANPAAQGHPSPKRRSLTATRLLVHRQGDNPEQNPSPTKPKPMIATVVRSIES
jgi:hypothetical protein